LLPDQSAILVRSLNNVPATGESCTTATQSGCLIVQGSGTLPSNTTLTLATSNTNSMGLGVTAHGIEIDAASDVIFQYLTLREAQEDSNQGSLSATGTVTETSGSITQTYATLTLDIMQPATPTPIQDLMNFAAIASGGSRYQASATSLDITLATTGGTCTQNAVLTVTTDSSGVVNQILAIKVPAICSTYPYATTLFAGTHGTNSSAMFYVAYLPSPMSQWINDYNFYLGSGGTKGAGFSAYMRAYSNQLNGTQYTPVSVPSGQNDPSGNPIRNFASWGSVPINGTHIFIPPVYVTSMYKHLWQLTLGNPIVAGSANPIPPYFSAIGNIVCMHTDYGGALAAGATGTDLNFNSMVWINDARLAFDGVDTISIMDSSIIRDTTTYPSNQLPCYGSGAGGPQIGQLGDPVTFGNVISNFTANATADDSVAVYNDIGGTGGKAQSNITNSTFFSPDGHPIRLANNAATTGIPDNMYDNLDSGTCPLGPIVGTTGSPVCVDSATQNQISSSIANCDTDYWNQPAQWGVGCPIWYSYAGFSKDPPP
jgi:hypothetical protein